MVRHGRLTSLARRPSAEEPYPYNRGRYLLGSDSPVCHCSCPSPAAYLTTHAITFTGVPTINDAYRQLESGGVDAIVFDAPVLRDHIKLTRSTNEILAGGIVARENYGIALPTGSALRKKINETLPGVTADGAYDELYSKYFEDANSG